jgi:hypothetical protein
LSESFPVQPGGRAKKLSFRLHLAIPFSFAVEIPFDQPLDKSFRILQSS